MEMVCKVACRESRKYRQAKAAKTVHPTVYEICPLNGQKGSAEPSADVGWLTDQLIQLRFPDRTNARLYVKDLYLYLRYVDSANNTEISDWEFSIKQFKFAIFKSRSLK